MNATLHKSNDTFTLTLSSEELNAILCAFDELEKVKYCRLEGHENSPFAIGAKKLHAELLELYTEQQKQPVMNNEVKEFSTVLPKTVLFRISNSHAVHEWIQKEYGSWEDHKCDANHACGLLQGIGNPKFYKNGCLILNEQQIRTLIESGAYQSTAWNEDEISGGEKTMRVIAKHVANLRKMLSEFKNS